MLATHFKSKFLFIVYKINKLFENFLFIKIIFPEFMVNIIEVSLLVCLWTTSIYLFYYIKYIMLY